MNKVLKESRKVSEEDLRNVRACKACRRRFQHALLPGFLFRERIVPRI